jgi:DNA-binding MarR family transcriptional regulator
MPRDPKPTPTVIDADLSESVLVALRRLMRAIDLHSKRLMHSHGLTGPQLLVLKALAEGPCAVGQLARKVRLSQPTVAEILARLQRRELVTRARSQSDRRCVLNTLSPAGRRKLEEAPPLLQEAFTARFADLPSWEQHKLLDALQRLAGLMDAGELEAAPLLSSGGLADDVALEAVAELVDPGVRAPGHGRR